MEFFKNRSQFQTVLMIQVAIVLVMFLIGFSFWGSLCKGTWASCISLKGSWAPITFLLLSVIRPLLFTPLMVLAAIGGSTFGPILGTLLTALGAALSCMFVYFPGKFLGVRMVRPWLSANLPATWQLIRTQDYKIAFISRWIPVFPFDFCSLLFGVANFNAMRTFVASFIGVLPEAYVFAKLASTPEGEFLSATILNLLSFGVVTTLPLLVYEFIFRKRGSSLWTQMKRTYYELIYEVRANNEIVKRRQFNNEKIPVILLYGFFSSRRSLTIMERLLSHRGFQVMSFNLGGSFGVFFTRGIKETAEFIDEKIRRQIERHDFKKVHIVAHSKGGLVALWWLLKLGGSKYCDKVITMGTPFRGSPLTYLGLATPLGFFWKDLWQMRPGSSFLEELHSAPIPPDVSIYCCYSRADKVATGRQGVFVPRQSKGQVIPVPMHHISHFEFLFRRDVGDYLAHILTLPPHTAALKPPPAPRKPRVPAESNG